jgi:mycothiol synthase
MSTLQLQARPYRDRADFAPMRSLLMLGRQAGLRASYMHPGCLDWATHVPPDEQANQRNLRLWETVAGPGPALAAWAIFQPHEGSFDLFVHPTLHGTPPHASLMDEYLAWAEALARAAGLEYIWPWWAMDEDDVLLGLMRARGFEVLQVDPAPPLFERVLDDLPPLQLPQGFSLQAVTTAADGRLRAQVTYAAFRSQLDWDQYAEHYAQFRGSTVYDAERDLLVRSPDGRGASASTLWFDPVNAIGLFEPVATHPDFQRLGLGQAVMVAGLHRMRAAGMRRAVLGFDPNNVAARALYTSLGFRAAGYFAVARKAVARSAAGEPAP